jgi:hypothetical protein
MSKKPLSSRKTRWAPSLSAFFYMAPTSPPPVLDGFLVPFEGATLRFLAAPTHASQKFPDVAGVILNSEPLVDHLGHAL